MLFRKLIRTAGRYRAQFISMIIMTALGIGIFVGFNMEWYTIERDISSFFERTGFSDQRIISAAGFSSEDVRKVKSIGGVENAARYISVNTSAKDGDTVALTVTEDIAVSGFIVTSGEEYDEKSADGIWLSDKYADANGIKTGDALSLGYKSVTVSGVVRGLIKSGEYLICIPDQTQLMPDYTTFGYAYISPVMLKSVIGAEFYTQINVITELETKQFRERVDRAFGKTMLTVSKDDTVSYSEAMGESKEGKTMGSILPVLFLAISVLTMVTTMHRLTASEKTQIGTLKALGFKDGTITAHYTSYAALIGVAGTALGVALGVWLGWFIMNPNGSMGTYIDMDDWSLHTPPFVWAVLVLINAFLVLIGFLSVRKMLRGTAADALRPYTPKKMRSLLIERLPLWDRLGFGAKWNLRDNFRHKARSAMTLFGTVGCTLLLVASFGMKDTMDAFLDTFYNNAMNYTYRINVDAEKASRDDVAALAEKYEADTCSGQSIQIDGQTFALEIYGISHDTQRFVGDDGGYVALSDTGAYVSRRVARDTGAGAGDTLTFSRYGESGEYTVKIEGILRSMTESVVMTEKYADSVGIGYTADMLMTKKAEVEDDPLILNTQSKKSIIDSFDTFLDVMYKMLILLVAAASALGVVVLYNLGVMSYTERYREMATLKVLGFRNRRIGGLLISQNMWMTLIGVIIGIPAGVGVLRYLLVALASEYELNLSLGPVTFIAATALTFTVSLIVGLMISRKNKKIDIVEALKTPE